MTGGTYTLVVELSEQTHLDVGALGRRTFAPGWYAYVGSALGSGGFARLDRHQELAAGDRDVRHWHIDYLLGTPQSAIDTVVRSAGVDGECTVADALSATDAFKGSNVDGFGCTDCRCNSHLFYSGQRTTLLGAIEAAHEQIRG